MCGGDVHGWVIAKAHVDFDVIVDVNVAADVVIDGAVDMSATFVVDRARVDINDKGGALQRIGRGRSSQVHFWEWVAPKSRSESDSQK